MLEDASRLSDAALRQAMPRVVAEERRSSAVAIAHIAEFEARGLHLDGGYPTMQMYCVAVLGYSEDAAWRRVKAAELSRRFPTMLPMLADGRLHLTAITMLANHLTSKNADGLFALASHKSKKTIETLLAERFPRPDLPTRLAPIPDAANSPTLCAVALARNESDATCTVAPARDDASDATLCAVAPARNESDTTLCAVAPARNDAPAKLAQRTPERFGLQVTIDQTTHDLLRRAQDLLSHQIPNGDLASVLRHVLEAAVPQLEKRKFGTARAARKSTGAKGRHIPMHVRHAVWKRDGGRCTFVAENGHRCESRKFLEFHHEEPFARGSAPTVVNIRLRCRAHNQYEAQRVFGAVFMEDKRAQAT